MWVFCEWNASQLTKHPLHANSSALAAYIGVNYRIPERTFWTWKFYKCFSEKFWNFFFAWNVLKHKVKPKNSRNSTFFQKLKFPPYFWKTLVKFSSPKCSLWYAVIFLSPREGKFKQNNNSACLMVGRSAL